MQRKGRGWEIHEQAISIFINVKYSNVISCYLIIKIDIDSLYTSSQYLKEILYMAERLISKKTLYESNVYVYSQLYRWHAA
jgi:hypothetical protein